MDFKSYNGIIITMGLVPALGVFIIIGLIWIRIGERAETLMLIVMKNIVSEKNIDKRPTYLVCHRKLSKSHREKILLTSVFIISICVQLFFLLAIIDVTYECINDSNLDCFKKKDDIKISDLYAYHESPVNCSSISRNDFVICYRITVFDPERGFIGAAAAYLLFKMLNFGLLVVAHVMLWVAQKWEKTTLYCFKLLFSLFIIIALCVPLILRIYVDKVESAFRKISYTVLMQVVLIVLVLVQFIAHLPWEEFGESFEYFGDVSLPLPGHTGEDENETTL